MNAQAKHAPADGTHAEDDILLPINAVERETGVSKELLRMWERRYDFPAPLRDSQGDRVYPSDQVAKLRLLRRLIDLGFRPGKIIALTAAELEHLLQGQDRGRREEFPELERELLTALRAQDADRTREYLTHQLVKLGLQRFVLDFLQHANTVVGDAWMRGELAVHEEHLFTEQIHNIVRHALGNLAPASRGPKVMLTTPPNESHTLGLLMVEALLRLDDVDVICYGAQMPARDAALAAQKQRMDILAVSCSASCPANKAVDYLEELRFRLPLSVDIWGGGSALRSGRRSIEGVRLFQDLASLQQAVMIWRRAHPGR